jgi:hypothetical protein
MITIMCVSLYLLKRKNNKIMNKESDDICNDLIDDLFANVEEIEDEPDECKGLIFRCIKSRCITSYDGIMEKTELRLLKRKSCPGCFKCGWVIDYLREDIDMYELEDDYIGNCEHGKLYTPNIVSSRDWESGIEEIDYIEFVEVIENDGDK